MKVIASSPMFLYHLQTMKLELWISLVTYLACCFGKQLQEGRMRCKMSNFTACPRSDSGGEKEKITTIPTPLTTKYNLEG